MKTKQTPMPGRCFDCVPGASHDGSWIGIGLCPVHAAALQMLDLLKRINWAFYVEGTAKALKPVMAETRALIAQAEGREVAK